MLFHRYSIDRNTDLERFFNIEATTGVISTAKALDREANAVHNITILATESCESIPSQIISTLIELLLLSEGPLDAVSYGPLMKPRVHEFDV